MKKMYVSETLGVVFAVLFISIVSLLVYMKYSGSCGLLGVTVESYIGAYLCEAPEDSDNLGIVNKDTDKQSENIQELDKKVSPNESNESNESVELPSTSMTNDPAEPVFSSSAKNAGIKNSDGTLNNKGSADSIQQENAMVSIDGEFIDPLTDPLMTVPEESKFETPALLVANNKLKITSLIQGKIKSIGFRDGESFKKGDILVLYDCKDFELDLALQKAVLKDNEANLRNLRDLYDLKSTSDYSIVQAEALLEQTQKLIEKLEFQISKCIIKAEYSGKVINTSITEYQYLTPGQEMMTVNNNEDLLVKAYVPVTWLDWLKEGSTFDLCFTDNDCFQGVVNRMGAEVDAISQTLDIFGKVTSGPNPKLIAGLSGQVTFDKV